ncbi:putative bifunctional diguanylate cyclase/phosphodiesterase [Hylemonella gracilis]|uniref:PAS family GGDEF/EAL protein n=1 Tax=Hylemonella gracilis ATCC 19624 TaxID=887062 RepID=F3KRQ5_9BURK|nr:EAL domain-containing protein [Hylemonella gracilis]EGI77506.1 PAS family GGDEF/EAL protein [Hylemonella gracilis ATCC 19624]
MSRSGHPSLRELRADITEMYNGEGPEAARMRGAHLSSLIRLTPSLMTANFGSGVLTLWFFTPDVPFGLWVWMFALCTVCGLAMLNWVRRRGRPVLTASSRSVHRATVHALLLAAVWGVLPALWFEGSAVGLQLPLVALISGMLGAGSFVLSPLPYASVAWAATISLGSIWALLDVGSAAAVSVGLLMSLYAPIVVIGSLVNWYKSTALLRAQAQSARQEQMLSLLLQDFEQNAGDALWETDADGRLRHASQRLRELLCLPLEGQEAEPLLALLSRRGITGAGLLEQQLNTGRPFRDLSLSIQDERGTVHLLMNGKPLSDENGAFLGWRGVLSDVTEKVRHEETLRRLAHTDSLTGLANRFMLRDTLNRLIAQKRPLALLAIDLDRFKAVNDNHGHSAGDAVLQAVAERLRAHLPTEALLARLGGDEFAVVLSEPADLPKADTLAQRVVDALAQPVEIGSRSLRIGASVGLTTRHNEPVSLDGLLVQADMAMYAAKESGRGRWARYTPLLGEHSRRQLAIEQGLRNALERGELMLHWQAKLDLASARITGAEALMRWTHPTLGPISPGEFIPVAEQCGLIDAMGQWALREACRAGTQELAGLTVAVNVSPAQLLSGHFLDHLRETLAVSGLEPGRLELEITESLFMEDAEQALQLLRSIRQTGVHLALDDFGTGFSSLSYLRSFPFDTLKIDQSFVTELLSKDQSRAIVRMIAELAATLGMRTVTEGVETMEQMQAVRAAGCDEVQGYLISRPRPLAEFQRSFEAEAATKVAG